MVGIWKAAQARSRELSHRLKEDMISQLPDPLIYDILSHLPIEDAVKTSVLSTRWKSLWLWVPSLELSSRKFPDFYAFKSFGDSFFDSNRASSIQKLIFEIYGDGDDEEDASYLASWIGAAVKRKVQHLDIGCYPEHEYLCEMPISLYICETLVSLQLSGVNMADAEFVSFPCLKSIHLNQILYPNEATFEKLVSSCPVLDDLKVIVARNDEKFYRVHSRSLKKLFFMRASPVQLDFVSGVVIDAPLLCCFSIYDDISNSIVVKNLESNAMLGMSLDFGLDASDEASVSARRGRFSSFLPGISRAVNLAVESDTFKHIHDYSKFEPLPQLPYLSCMVATVCVSDLKCFPTFLQSCPKLKTLVLGLDDYEEMPSEEMNQISHSSVPECLLRSLEFVGFKSPISGHAAEMKLVKYFLENSAILKELTLHVNRSRHSDIFKELLKIPRRSATCQILVS